MEIIRTQDVRFSYHPDTPEETHALNGITLAIKKGEFISVLGRNGSGKSTLAKLFNALLLPSAGVVYVKGYDTTDKEFLWEIRSTVGMVFQNPDNQIIGTTVEEDVAFGPENQGIEQSQIRKRVDEAILSAGLKGYEQKEPHMLSGGQKQRTAIAGILALRPEVIVLDEATSMLDPTGRKEVISLSKRLSKEDGITVINITHIMDETIDSDRIVVLDSGKVMLSGTPREVFGDIARIRQYGLDAPHIACLFSELREEGLPLSAGILTADDAAESIRELLDGN